MSFYFSKSTSRPNDDLLHYGIKGQKWGIRRYQNEDGTLTEAGKKRYAISQKAANYASNTSKAYYESASKTQSEADNIRKKYSGDKGIEQYRKDTRKDFDDQEYFNYIHSTKQSTRNVIDNEIGWREDQARYDRLAGKKWADKADHYMNTPISELSGSDFSLAKKYAKQFDKYYGNK